MGNQKLTEFSIWKDEFDVLDQQTPNIFFLLHKTTEQQYLGCRIQCTNTAQYQQVRQIVDYRIFHSNPYVADIQRVSTFKNKQYCSQIDSFYLLFKKPMQNLKKNSMGRKYRNQNYSQEEASVVLQTGIRGLMYLEDIDHPFRNFSMDSIYLQNDYSLILGDPYLSNWQITTIYPYPSPQQIKLNGQERLYIDLFASSLFSLGIIILELINLEHMDILYEKGYSRLRWNILNEYLNQIHNENLKMQLAILLHQNPNKRKQIYINYKGTPNSTYQFTIGTRKKFLGMIKKENQNYSKHKYNKISQQFSNNLREIPRQIKQEKQRTVLSKPTNIRQINENKCIIKRLPPQLALKRPNHNIIFKHNINQYPSSSNSKPIAIPIHISYHSKSQFQKKSPNNIPTPIYTHNQYNNEIIAGNDKLEQIQLKDKKHSIIDEIQQFNEQQKNNSSLNKKSSSNFSNSIDKFKINESKCYQPHKFISEQIIRDSNADLQLFSIDPISIKGPSNNSDSSLLQSMNQIQVDCTPSQKPKKEQYNSTIKQVTQMSASISSDQHSQETVEYQMGNKYSGQLKKGVRNGYGTFFYSDGSKYKGEWKNNKMHGKGSLYYANGKLAYEGRWFMDDFHGQGTIFNHQSLPLKKLYDYHDFSHLGQHWANYSGQLAVNQRHGKGKLKLSNGQILQGNFEQNMVHGDGIFYCLDGKIIEGRWKFNKLQVQRMRR